MSENVNGKAEMAAQLQEVGRGGFALAVQLLGNRDDAAETLQDAVHAALRDAGRSAPPKRHFQAWFLTIVRNRCRDRLRQRRLRVTQPIETARLATPSEEQPEAIAQRREMVELLRAELAAMDAADREIIVLRDFQKLRYKEIARVLSIGVGTVMSRLHRARMELKNRMEKYA